MSNLSARDDTRVKRSMLFRCHFVTFQIQHFIFSSSFLTITIILAEKSFSFYYDEESQEPDIEQLNLVYLRLPGTAGQI